jgi:uncharacterized membrane protein YcaP (DUF421 family)
MMNKNIHLSDISRILVGDVPPEFFIEITIRLIIMYLFALIAMRLMGKRLAAQLSRNELTALVSIAAAVGVAIQAPDKGLLPALIIVTIIIMIGRWIAWRTSVNQKFEKIAQGNIAALIKDSVLQLHTMESARISKERVFAQLRSEQIKSLGAVKRFYMEANGQFSLIKEDPPKPGLSIIPHWDKDMRAEQEQSSSIRACESCGFIWDQSLNSNKCLNCQAAQWTMAVKDN